MYPSSTSSSSQGSLGPSSNTSGLTRYGSAPGSLLTTAVDSVIAANRDYSTTIGSNQHHHHQHQHLGPSRYYSPETSSFTSESTCKTSSNSNNKNNDRINAIATAHSHSMEHHQPESGGGGGLHRSYLFKDMNSGGSGGGGGGEASSSSSLVRHSSSPAGFLNQLVHSSSDDGFSVTRGIGSYGSKGISDSRGGGISRLNSQLSFTRQEALSQIAEESESVADVINTDKAQRKSTHSFSNPSFGIGSWEDSNSIMFSMAPNKRSKTGSDMMNGLHGIESQFQFGMPQTTLEMATMENYLHIPQDSVPCKIRAKRGCATHPRSIAERERRTRISGKLKNLQDLVPNMDKQTSYADMLDLAVQHIKSLQSQIQSLHNDLENCTCGCKKST